MKRFLLRVEGVNLSQFIEDTQDLSTIRGGGLLLLNVAESVRGFLAGQGCTVTPVIEGASQGLFEVQSSISAEEIRRNVERKLSTDLPHATFVVDVYEPGEEEAFPLKRATVLARNRWRQMQAPSVIYPAIANIEQGAGVCGIDMVRPGVHYDAAAQRWESDSVNVRRLFGRRKKQEFYQEEMGRGGLREGRPFDFDYALDFEGLCGDSERWGNLQNKMAVIHLDGNRFGRLQDELNDEERQKRFSKGLRDLQAAFLRDLISEKVASSASWWNKERVVRLETLLWGGDEIIWVVPAWKGWDLLQFFFQRAKGWEPAGIPLTHSAGLVFCHQKAPIHTITKLARELVNMVKEANGEELLNGFAYQVLESFDHIGRPLTKPYLKSRYSFLVGSEEEPGWNRLVLDGEQMQEISFAMPFWRDAIPRRKLHEITRALMNGDLTTAKQVGDGVKAGLRTASASEALLGLEALERMVGGHPAYWYHITELWDYVAPEEGEGD